MKRSDEGKAYRQSRRQLMGETVYKTEEARKRRERRNRAKSQTSEQKEELQDIINVLQTENCNDLLEQVFKAKSQYLASLKIPKTIKKSSVAQQLTKVKNIYKKITGANTNCSEFKFLKDTDKVINFVNTHWKTPNSRNSQIQAISSIIQALDGYEKEYNFYSEYSSQNRVKINTKADKSILTESESKNILPWKDIKDLHTDITDKRDRALVGIYTLLPPRRVEDISLLTITDTDEKLNENFNYLIVDKNKAPKELIYLNYKTNKTYGKQIIDIPLPLKKILKEHIKDLNLGDPVFGTVKKGYYKNFSEIVSKTFKKYTGKKLSANLLRHSFVSSFLNTKQSVSEKKKIAKQMGHSKNTQDSYDRLDL